LQQFGRLKINRLEVLLVCEEEATFRHGTNTRTESRVVAQQSLMLCQDAEVRHGVPFESDCDLEVPPGAMHSFKSQHNEVNWKLQVQLDVAGWPAYERSFPVIVYPAPVAGAADRLPVPASRAAAKRPAMHGAYDVVSLPEAPADRNRSETREGAAAKAVNERVSASSDL
jgi:hypothetical protein